MEPITLERIENDRRITRETDGEFLYEYQKAVLLALVESGRRMPAQKWKRPLVANRFVIS